MKKLSMPHGMTRDNVVRFLHGISLPLQASPQDQPSRRLAPLSIRTHRTPIDFNQPPPRATQKSTAYPVNHQMTSTGGKNVDVAELVESFLAYLNESWTAYHATAEARRRLLAAGFVELDESEPTHNVKPGGKYFFTRNMSAIAAFAVGGAYTPGDGFIIVGAHTDSPCPKLKPVSKSSKSGFVQVGTQPYGGGLWHTWFDRDLGIAGRVIVKRGPGRYSHDLVKIDRPILRIPTLAIHLTSGEERKNFGPNLHNHFYPMLATEVKAKLGVSGVLPESEQADHTPEVETSKVTNGSAAKTNGASRQAPTGGSSERHHALLIEMLAKELGCEADDVEDFELQLCDTQPSCLGGACSEFLVSGRLDNLCSSWQSIAALIDSSDGASLASAKGVRSMFLFDHEEVGSNSCEGAAGTLLPDCMKRLAEGLAVAASGRQSAKVVMESIVRKSFLVSADMAHALHPNYSDRHDPALGPKMHGGMVLKHNANQRYATNAVTAFLFREMGRRAGLPTQEFAVKSDSACGSTIGPALSTLSGIRTVDVGSPQLAMHSIREMMGVDDAVHGYEHMKAIFQHFFELDSQLKVDAAPSCL